MHFEKVLSSVDPLIICLTILLIIQIMRLIYSPADVRTSREWHEDFR